ncbi:unnamed protein product [Brachionus calyciflorus]|uniref:Cytochrome p450 n=1 Tax=Brachionus calyciflorus TaxID=104777 RepID=A0A814BAR3_9BILA|nr:unnamed protein product [Brachionus calyciflorus]
MNYQVVKTGFKQIIDLINEQELFTFIYDDPYILIKLASATLLGLSTFYFSKIWYSYRFFKNRNIPTPPYRFFYGNNLELTRDNNYSEIIQKWTEKYGKTYGYYEGHFPVVVTSDLEIIQEKIFGSRDDNAPDHMLFTASRTKWKVMRNIMNPTFSAAKLREIGPLIVKSADRLNQVLSNEGENEINISEFFKRFTMDSIWMSAFGEDIDVQNNPENKFFKKCEEMFVFMAKTNLTTHISNYFHEFQEIFLQTVIILEKFFSLFIDFNLFYPIIWFTNHVFEIVDRHKMEKGKKKNFLQLLIDAESDAKDDLLNIDDYTKVKLNKKLSQMEIKLNLTLFMFAGYETTSTTLSYATYILAKYPDEQLKLFEAISTVLDKEEDVNSENVLEIEYLEWFVKEVLRIYPIANSAVARRCTKSTKVKNIDVPEGLVIAVDVMSLHFDKDLWGPVDPNEFYPPRHETKRNPLGFMSFGNGPRNCIGMKFALIELKIALCKLILNFEILPSKKFPERLELIETIVRRPKNGYNVILKKRNL